MISPAFSANLPARDPCDSLFRSRLHSDLRPEYISGHAKHIFAKDSMNAISIDAPPPFHEGGRGPILHRWLHDSDLLFADSIEGFGPPVGGIEGALVEGNAWVIFHGLQVVRLFPTK